MSRIQIQHVKKRDGRVVTFDPEKITQAIHAAAKAVQQDDFFLAQQLTEVVSTYLAEHFQMDVPHIEDIQDMVERVLIETSHVAIAKAYILYREARLKRRQALSLFQDHQGNAFPIPLEHWDKKLVRHYLQTTTSLGDDVVEKMASTIEQRIMNAGYTCISMDLIRGMVEHEVLTHHSPSAQPLVNEGLHSA